MVDDEKVINISLKTEGLSVKWDEEHESIFPFRFLRAECRCAFCVDEITRERRIGLQDVALDIKIEDWIDVGKYAIQILWSDGHSEGIYPFKMLLSLCPCKLCFDKGSLERD